MLCGKNLVLFWKITVANRSDQHKQYKEYVAECCIFQSLSNSILFWCILWHKWIKYVFLIWSTSCWNTRRSWTWSPSKHRYSIYLLNVVLRRSYWLSIICKTICTPRLIRRPDMILFKIRIVQTFRNHSFSLLSLQILHKRLIYVWSVWSLRKLRNLLRSPSILIWIYKIRFIAN